MKRIKEWWQRFRQWQYEPLYYKEFSNKKNVCNNCGLEFVGDFCPRCSQPSRVGKNITWNTLSLGLMATLDIPSRSLPRTLWHLLLRPGYLIGDYINGHRQMSYPPIKMLMLVAICALIIDNPSLGMGWTEVTEETVARNDVDRILIWAGDHLGWTMLALSSLLILPTWIIFRYAPLHSFHTLPEGFYIQVFMSTLALMIFIFSYISDWLFWLILLYYIITYRQLFGYGLWGTMWRVLVGLLEVVLELLTIVGVLKLTVAIFNKSEAHPFGPLIITTILMVLLGVAVYAIANKINKRNLP